MVAFKKMSLLIREKDKHIKLLKYKVYSHF